MHLLTLCKFQPKWLHGVHLSWITEIVVISIRCRMQMSEIDKMFVCQFCGFIFSLQLPIKMNRSRGAIRIKWDDKTKAFIVR